MHERWYWCAVTEYPEEQPDFSRVPEDRRTLVENRWKMRNADITDWKMWGPQIPWYKRNGYKISVLSEVDRGPCPGLCCN